MCVDLVLSLSVRPMRRKGLPHHQSKPKSMQKGQIIRQIIGTHNQGRVSEPCNRRPFRAVWGHLSQLPAPDNVLTPSHFWANSPLYYKKNEIVVEFKFATVQSRSLGVVTPLHYYVDPPLAKQTLTSNLYFTKIIIVTNKNWQKFTCLNQF